MNIKPLFYVFAFVALIAAGSFLQHSCERKPDPKPIPAPAEAERKQQRTTGISKAEHEKAVKLAAERLTQIEALQRTIIAETGKRKQAEQKARESAAAYAKNPSLHTCHTALVDCQYENETKAYSLAVQERMIAEYDSLQKIQVSEIDRQVAVIDTLAEGWRVANVNNAEMQKQLQKEQNKLRVYATGAFEKHPLNNNIKIGATATHKRKLFSYEKGVIQNTHEFKAGWLLW